jgi:hypothetical protein
MFAGRSVVAVFLAAMLLVLPPLCGTAAAHAAFTDAARAAQCCMNVNGTATDPAEFAAGGDRGKTPLAAQRFTHFFTRTPHVLPALSAAPGVRARSFYARSSRILR